MLPSAQRQRGDRIKVLPCGHIFHLHCLQHWLRHMQQCPVCRAEMSERAIRTAAAARQRRELERASEEAAAQEARALDEAANPERRDVDVGVGVAQGGQAAGDAAGRFRGQNTKFPKQWFLFKHQRKTCFNLDFIGCTTMCDYCDPRPRALYYYGMCVLV